MTTIGGIKICHRRLQYWGQLLAYGLLAGLVEYGRSMPEGHWHGEVIQTARPAWWSDYAREGFLQIEQWRHQEYDDEDGHGRSR